MEARVEAPYIRIIIKRKGNMEYFYIALIMAVVIVLVFAGRDDL